VTSGSRRVLAWVAALVASTGLILGDVGLARRVASAPARCAEGMALLGARCCGEGQRIEGTACIGEPRRCAAGLVVTARGCVPGDPQARREIPGGTLVMAPQEWEAAGSVAPRIVHVEPFSIDVYEVTEARWETCVAQQRCNAIPLRGEPGLPVTRLMNHEAVAFCTGAGGRLPVPDELAMAATGGVRRYPWGPTGFVCRRAAWGLAQGPCAWGADGPEIVGAHPAGATPEGVQDLSGNVAEWTSTVDATAAAVIGGSWNDVEAAALRTWSQSVLSLNTRSATVGFRCVYPRSP
jgi:formylglycine-generating enzyme required for sulfatase activity